MAHLVVLLLLFKAAVPLMASAAASLQGRPVAEICDIYGVALPAHGDKFGLQGTPVQPAGDAHVHHHHGGDGAHPAEHGSNPPAEASASAYQAVAPNHDGPGEGSRHDRSHRGDHCALNVLGTFACPDGVGAPFERDVGSERTAGIAWRDERVPDASARWAVLLKHGPPGVS
jgi:hypothetical protein